MARKRSKSHPKVCLQVSLSLAAALWLAACPNASSGVDAGAVVAENPSPKLSCSGGCGENQVCDVVSKQCVDACGGCTGGSQCVKVSAGVFECRPTQVSCSGVQCAPGLSSCVDASCTCTGGPQPGRDSCAVVGKWCSHGGCQPGDKGQQCWPGSNACRTNLNCTAVFGETLSFCLTPCLKTDDCEFGEICYDALARCIPEALIVDQACSQMIVQADGGALRTDAGELELKSARLSETCLIKNEAGVVIDDAGVPGGSGNCTNRFMHFWQEGLVPLETCRPPGLALENQPCKGDRSRASLATLCATGLECAPVLGSNDGICLRLCNAAQVNGSDPRCAINEVCVNVYRLETVGQSAQVGVCAQTCSVFNESDAGCAPIGSLATSCLPTAPNGEVNLTADGTGLCLPQHASAGAQGTPCRETDLLRGSACQAGLVCASTDSTVSAQCSLPCDVRAGCPSGMACHSVSSTEGARLGLCR